MPYSGGASTSAGREVLRGLVAAYLERSRDPEGRLYAVRVAQTFSHSDTPARQLAALEPLWRELVDGPHGVEASLSLGRLHQAVGSADAVEWLRRAHLEAAGEGRLLSLDAHLRAAFKGQTDRWQTFVWALREELVGRSALVEVVSLAHAVSALGEGPQADRLLADLLAEAPSHLERRLRRVLADYYLQRRLAAEGLAALTPLLSEEAGPELWWQKGELEVAGRSYLPAVRAFERALAGFEETDQLRAMRLDSFRSYLSTLLGTYLQLAAEASASEAVAAECRQGVLRTVARWRRVDPQVPYELAAQTLSTLGLERHAWWMLSSLLEDSPGQGSGLLRAAAALRQAGKLHRALALCQRAEGLEPTDPTPLLEQARILQQLGREGDAKTLYRRIVEQAWNSRFSGQVGAAQEALAQ
jgi:hypothetical protein